MAKQQIMDLMTQAQYARHRGVMKQAVNNLVRRGKIPVEQKGRCKLIHHAAADFALGEARERIKIEDDQNSRPGGAELTRAKTETEQYRARIAQLDMSSASASCYGSRM